jgi:prepilin-type N-terminal cleavage/methylation domain-containing protein
VTHATAKDQSGVTLVELLVGLVITALLSSMMLMVYFALSGSFSYSAKSTTAREQARQALARMAREIRDAEALSSNTEVAVVRARERWIQFYSTFNEEGNDDPSMAPHLVLYRLYQDKEIWRFEDQNNDGTIAGVNINPASESTFSLAEQTNGEGRMLIVKDVVNYDSNTPSPVPLFAYSYVDDDGQIAQSSYVYYTENRVRILNVQIHLLVDLNPGHSPVYADLQTSAQLRNQRIQ